MRHLRAPLALVAAAVLVLSVTSLALAAPTAVERPFHATIAGSNFWLGSEDPDGNPLGCGEPFGETTFTAATGTAAHLGHITYVGMHCPSFGIIDDGEVVIIAANGDELYATYVAVIDYFPEEIGGYLLVSSSMTFGGGTGRFVDAEGSADAVVTIRYDGFEDADWPLTMTWSGALSY